MIFAPAISWFDINFKICVIEYSVFCLFFVFFNIYHRLNRFYNKDILFVFIYFLLGTPLTLKLISRYPGVGGIIFICLSLIGQSL